MTYLVLKYIITAFIIVGVSELAKVSDKFGALVISLPLMTILTLFWLHFDGVSTLKISNHMYYTFWYVLPTLPMFLTFPFFLEKFGFWGALGLSVVMTIIIFFIYSVILKRFGIFLI
ncbi:DUF3147 family protein [Candidatus Gracilibacteria bacterium]|nr:DUF3147 family protein [Candidatus Gracilibacteria bacterium]